MKKKILLLAAVFVFLLVFSAITANAATVASGTCGVNGDNLTWTLDDEGTLTISGTGDMANWTSYLSVSPWYSYRYSIHTITIGNKVTSIGDYAFYDCCGFGLRSITIPNSVTSIGNSAFRGCGWLTDITIPDSVTNIGNEAFLLCRMTSITIPDSVTNIGDMVFGYCNFLTSINVNENNKMYSSKDGVLFNKDKTTLICYPAGITGSYSIPDNVTNIGDYAFYYCKNLTSITISDCVTNIGSSAFDYCDNLADVNISDLAAWCNILFSSSSSNPLIYAENIYLNGERVTELTIPNNVTSIGDYAFYKCNVLTSITIGTGVTSIGKNAFGSCDSLRSINVNENNKMYSSKDGVLFNEDKTILICYPTGAIGAYSIPNSVTSIGNSAFENCTGLTSITIPDSVTSIGNSAFEDCTSLTSITISDSVINIRERAFSFTGYYNNTLNWENGVLYIGNHLISTKSLSGAYAIKEGTKCIADNAFDFRTGLTSITIPDSVTSIGNYAFKECTNLTSVSLGNSVTSIGRWAFYYCSDLINITIPDSVITIGSYAFMGCAGLTSITIGSGVTSIGEGEGLFQGCESLTNINVSKNNHCYILENGVLFNKDKTMLISCPVGVTGEYIIPDSVTTIGGAAFNYCRNLTSIIIPDSVTSIKSCAFECCTGLTSIAIPNSITYIESETFYGCNQLRRVNISNLASWCNISFLNASANPLFYAKKLYLNDGLVTELNIPENITKIKAYVFINCDSLTNITIPDSVTNIGYAAFYDCNSLTDVYYDGLQEQWNKITIGNYNDSLTSATIHFDENNPAQNVESVIICDDGYYRYYIDGYVQTGWQVSPEGYKYYFSTSSSKYGAALIGKNQKIASTYYNFTSDGKLIESYDSNGNPVLFCDPSQGVLYTVTYNPGVGSCGVAKRRFRIGTEADLTVEATMTGMTFAGWSDKENSDTALSSFTVNADATLYAVYTDLSNYNVELCSDGYYRFYIAGVAQTGWQVATNGNKYYFSTSSSKYGAAIVGKRQKIASTYYDFTSDGKLIESYDSDGNPVLYYEEAKDLRPIVTYDYQTNGGISASKTIMRVEKGNNADLTVTAEKNGAEFIGWNTDKNTKTALSNYKVTGNVTLYAIFSAVANNNGVILDTDGYYRYYNDGEIQTKWQVTPDGYKYYFSTSASKYGAAMTGKNIKIGGAYYDFTDDGKLISGYDTNGNPILYKELNGFVTDDKGITRYYVNNEYVIGWNYINGYKYYFSKSNGKLLTGNTKIGSLYYNLGTDGAWVGYYQAPKSEEECLHSDLLTKDADGKYRYYVNGEPFKGWKVLKGDTGYYKYYFSKSSALNGAAITTYATTVGSEIFDFSPTGTLITVTRMDNGNAMMSDYILSFTQGAKNGVVLDEDGEYRYYIDGEFQSGLITVDGVKYLFRRADGSAITSDDHQSSAGYRYGSFNYIFDDTGKMISRTLR